MRDEGKGRDDVTVRKTAEESKVIVLADHKLSSAGKATREHQEMLEWCHKKISEAADRLADEMSRELSCRFEKFKNATATIRLELRRREEKDGETDEDD